MKQAFILGLVFVFGGFAACDFGSDVGETEVFENENRSEFVGKVPVLVELFTSEG